MGNKSENKETKVISYTPKWHNKLLEYMKTVFPHRSVDYLNWWIDQMDASGIQAWEKSILVLHNEMIIGCTTVCNSKLKIGGDTQTFYIIGNTIISQNFRGKGLSKQLYGIQNSYRNYITVGITEIAWKIQPKYVKNFVPISPVNVYISINRCLFGIYLWQIFAKRGTAYSSFTFPNMVAINNHETFRKVDEASYILDKDFNGRWMSDSVEFIRDQEFLRKRFFEIYCKSRYGVYRFERDGVVSGYIVVRPIIYQQIVMVALVDYRFVKRSDECKAFIGACKIAKANKIGLVLTLSSRIYPFSKRWNTFMTWKKLNCAIGINDYVSEFTDILITSADSDLDFVYYK